MLLLLLLSCMYVVGERNSNRKTRVRNGNMRAFPLDLLACFFFSPSVFITCEESWAGHGRRVSREIKRLSLSHSLSLLLLFLLTLSSVRALQN